MEAQEPRDTRRKRILLSDSPELILAVRESILQTSQVSALVASSAAEVLAVLRQWQPDLLILGPQEVASVSNAIKGSADFQDIPVIAVVRDLQESSREDVLASGCDEWISLPIDELKLLSMIQDLTGLRFRKLPRLSFEAPAMVTFKGKEFSSNSIDINRRMIFLESHQGLVPATGRNVKLRFQISRDETVVCWGRIIKLMARRSHPTGKETIGMLIRFLDLPERIARRIDILAQKQAGTIRLLDGGESGPSQWDWPDVTSYEQALQKIFQGQKINIAFALPEPAVEAFSRSLSAEETAAYKSDSSKEEDKILRFAAAARFKAIDELAKIRTGGPSIHAKPSLELLEAARRDLNRLSATAIEAGQAERVVALAHVKSEVVRTDAELSILLHGRPAPVFPESEEEASQKSTATSGTTRKPWGFAALAAIVLLLMLFVLRNSGSGRIRDFSPGDLGKAGQTLENGRLIQAGEGMSQPWASFEGVVNDVWYRYTTEGREAALRDLSSALAGHSARHIYLYSPSGKLEGAWVDGRTFLLSEALATPEK